MLSTLAKLFGLSKPKAEEEQKCPFASTKAEAPAEQPVAAEKPKKPRKPRAKKTTK